MSNQFSFQNEQIREHDVIRRHWVPFLYYWPCLSLLFEGSWSPRPISVLIIDQVFRADLGPFRGLTLGRSGRLNVSHHILLEQDITNSHRAHASKILAAAHLVCSAVLCVAVLSQRTPQWEFKAAVCEEKYGIAPFPFESHILPCEMRTTTCSKSLVSYFVKFILKLCLSLEVTLHQFSSQAS